MAAQGNQTTYQRAEGESTQWEDIQRRLGNLPKKEKPQKAKPFEPAAERDKVIDVVEADTAEELETLEDEFADDAYLEQYRELRLRQLSDKAKAQGFGSVMPIQREGFVAEVTEASQHSWVIAHLYKDRIPLSTQMGECLDKLAAKYNMTKFVKIQSNDCIPGYPDRNLPTVLVYKDRKCVHNLVGIMPYLGRLSPEYVAEALNKLGPICQEKQTASLQA